MERLLTCIFTVLCLVSGSIVVAERTTISYTSQKQIKDIGETVEFYCFTQYAQDNPVVWVKVNRENPKKQMILSSGTALQIRDSRFAIRCDTASATYVLQIKDIQEEDAGFYQCEIQLLSANNVISAKVELKFRKPPIIIIMIIIGIIIIMISVIIISVKNKKAGSDERTLRVHTQMKISKV